MNLYKQLKNKIRNSYKVEVSADNETPIIGKIPILELPLPILDGKFVTSIFNSGIPGIIMGQDNDLNISAIVFTHEVGHMLDWIKNPKEFTNIFGKASNKWHKGKQISKKEKQIVYAGEVKAWKLGRKFLGSFVKKNDPIWKVFNKTRQKCLKTYAQALK